MNNSNELYHHGILGMKWGVRRFQNNDGSLTSAGKKRYNSSQTNDTDSKINKTKPKQTLTTNHRIALGLVGVAALTMSALGFSQLHMINKGQKALKHLREQLDIQLELLNAIPVDYTVVGEEVVKSIFKR